MNRIIEANFLPAPVEDAKEKPRILIIDNNLDFTHSAKLALERTGRYSVWEENVPARAHQTAQRVKPDLILLDIAMPETDGGEVAARIESDPTLHRITVVFLTALVTKLRQDRDCRSTDIHFSPSQSAFQSWSQAFNDICPRTQRANRERPLGEQGKRVRPQQGHVCPNGPRVPSPANRPRFYLQRGSRNRFEDRNGHARLIR
jgi:CheY-like chemotaxis protein